MKRNRIYGKYLWAMGAMLLLIATGCSKNDPASPDKGTTGGPDGNGNRLSLSVSINSSLSNSRAVSDGLMLRKEESMVYEVRVVFYSEATDEIIKVVPLDACNVDDPLNPTALVPFRGAGVLDGSGTTTSFVSPAILFEDELLEIGRYKMIMLINPTDEIKTKTEMGGPQEMTLTELTNEVVYYSDPQEMVTMLTGGGKRFMMTNIYGPQTITRRGNFWKVDTDAQKNPVWVPLVRSVAAILPCTFEMLPQRAKSTYRDLKVYLDGVTNTYADYITWDVDVTNRKSYWMRKPIASENKGNFYELYAQDPNFSGQSSVTGGKTLDERKLEFRYLEQSDIDNGKVLEVLYRRSNPNNMFKNAKYVYVPENTVDGSEQYGDVMTSVVIGLNIYAETEMADRRSSDPGEPESRADMSGFPHLLRYKVTGDEFYMSAPDYLWPGELDELYNDFYKDYWDKDNNNFVTLPPPMEGETEEYIKNWTQWLTPKMHLIEYLETYQAYTGQIDYEVKWDDFGSFEFKSLTFYEHGRMYFTIPVAHFGSDTEPGEFGRYGVVRGNFYVLEIMSIRGGGSIKPELPITPMYDAMDIRVIPWEEIENDFNFGGGAS